MRERPIVFGGAAELAGILAEPESQQPAGLPVVLFLNAGLLHKVGPHRLHVDAARALAADGVPSFRFDLSNTGDSGPRADRKPFEESSVEETREALDRLEPVFPGRRFVLFGLCSGAMVAVKTAVADARVAGLILVNTQSHTTDPRLQRYVSHKKESHYFWKVSIFSRDSWRRVLTGRSRYFANLKMLLRQMGAAFRRAPAFESGAWDMAKDFESLAVRALPVLHFFSQGDPAFEIYRAVVGHGLDDDRGRENVHVEVVSGADHTFTPSWSRVQLLQRMRGWIASLPAAAARTPGAAGGARPS